MKLWNNIVSLFRRGDAEAPAPAPAEASTGAVSAARTGDTSLLLYSDTKALCVAAVYRCVKLLSESVANLPVLYMKRRADGLFVADNNSRLAYLLNVQPDPNYSAFDFWVHVVTNILLDGNAYIVPVYNPVTMEIDRLALCNRGTVAHDTLTDTYTISDLTNGVYGTYDENEIIHIKGLCIPGSPHDGVSVLTFARLTVNVAATGDNETLNRFANGGNVHGIVSNDTSVRGFGEYQDKQLEETAALLDKKLHSGERIVSLPGQVDFKQLSLSSTDMQFLESRKFAVRDICRFFGVHPSFVFDDTSNNYKSAEQANVAFLSHTLNPLLRSIESELLRKLVAANKATKYRITFDRRGIYACDLDSKIKYQSATIAAGIYTVNDWRLEENRAPVEGGDVVLVSANLRPITEAGQPAPGVPAAPAQDDNNEDKNDDGEK